MASPRIEQFLSELTLDEKISLLAGQNMWETVPVPRLNIPSFKTTDGPNGARGAAFHSGTRAACFPASVSLAAGFDEEVAEEIGRAIAQEAKSKGAYVLLAPTVCLHRSPLGGRNFESFSEDPLLTGKLAARYIKGVQSERVAATIKHFAANEQETRRFTMNVNASERALRELYLKPFEMAIKQAKPWAVMTSYNLVNGVHADCSEFLLQTVLRGQWKWSGLVMSDWGGTNAGAQSVRAGLDLEMPGPAIQRTPAKIRASVEAGEVTVKEIDKCVTEILTLAEKIGKFDDRPDTPAEQAIDLPEHRALIRKAGAAGTVLLRNERNILPLSKEKQKRIAVLGLAKECVAHGGGSAAVNCHYKISPWDALTNHLGEEFDLRFAQGAHMFRNLPEWQDNVTTDDGKPGFTFATYASTDMAGKPLHTGIAPAARHMAGGGLDSLMSDTPSPTSQKPVAMTLQGTYVAPSTASHYLSLGGLGVTRLLINGDVVLDTKIDCPDSMAFLLGGATEETCQYSFEAGKSYKIRVETFVPAYNPNGIVLLDGVVSLRLGFMEQGVYEEDVISPAVAAAKDADVALVFVGNTATWETEGQDRAAMDLPAHGSQDRLIEAVCAVNKNVVVVISAGSPVSMPWLDKTSAVVQAWYGGQESGNSIVDVLYGVQAPGGKLPVTFPKSVEDTPCHGNFPGDVDSLQVYYKEGVYMGYRHYDKHPDTQLFPFGFGLSYTTFETGDVSLLDTTMGLGGSVRVRATVKNTGPRKGSEVVQVYLSSPGKAMDVPLKQLAGFQKVELSPGASQTVEVSIGYESAAYWDEKSKLWTVEAGEYVVRVGNSAQNITGHGTFTVESGFAFEP